MSTEIDKRIVEMEFRNQEFEKNAERTRKTLEELEKSLDFDNDVSKSLDIISSKFTNMGIIGQTVLKNLTDSVVDLGKTIVKSLTIDGITEGFGQYESINSSTKVLMNATGDSLATVTQYLQELQSYAQATVYDFAFMTENITKFVNSGLDLKLSVTAMEGLGNAMAYVGVEGAQANQVIYNVSQALSTGFMGLQDWKSLELAGMATKNFKQVLLDTAVEMGTVVKVGEKYRSLTTDLNGKVSDLMDTETMRNELASRWLTNDVLIAALSKYSDESTELGKAAAAAARNITSFSKMIDALTEERSGGWASSFRIIFGDLEEATEMWTNIYTRIEKWMSSIAEFRNNVLQAWAGFGGRNESIQAFHNILDIVEGLSSPMGKALDKLLSYNKGWQYLEETTDTINIGPLGNVLYESMVKASRAVNSFTQSLVPSEKTLRSITDILTGLFTIVRDIITILSPVIVIIGKVIKIITPLFKIVLAIGGVLGNIILQISNAVREALNLGPAFKNVTEFLDSVYNAVNNFADKAVDKIYEIPEKFSDILANLKNFKFPNFKNIASGIVGGFTNAVDNFKQKKTLSSFFEGFFSTESIKNIGEAFSRIFKNILSNVRGFTGNLRETLLSLGPVGNFVVSVFDLIISVITNVINSVKKLFPELSGTVEKTTGKLSGFLSDLKISDAIDLVKIAAFTISMAKLKKSIVSIGDIAREASKTVASVRKGIEKFSETIENVGKGVKMRLQAEAFKNIAYGMGVIVASIIALTTVNSSDLENAVKAFAKIVALIGALTLVVGTFGSKLETAFVIAASLGALTFTLGALAILIGVITSAVDKLGKIDPKTSERGVNALIDVLSSVAKLAAVVAAAIVVMALVNKIPTKSGAIENLMSISTSIVVMAIGLLALYKPIKMFGEMDPATFVKGFAALATIVASVALLFGSLTVIKRKIPDLSNDLVALSVSMIGLSISLNALMLPIFALGSMKTETLTKGLIAIGSVIIMLTASLIGLGAALRIMGKNNQSIFKMVSALSILAASFTVVSLIAPMIMDNADKVKDAVTKLMEIVVSAIVDSSRKITRGLLELVSDVLINISGYLPMILIELETILTQVIDWLISYLPSLTKKVGEAIGILVTGIAESIKNNINLQDLLITMSTLLTIIVLLKSFARLSDDVTKAIPVFIALTLVVAALGAIIHELVTNDVDGKTAISSAVSLSILLRTLIGVAKRMPDIIKSFDNVDPKSILKMFALMAILIAGLSAMYMVIASTSTDPLTIISYAAAVSVSLLAITPMIKVLSSFQTSANGLNIGQILGVIVEVGGIAAALAWILSALTDTGLNPIEMAKYAGALSVAFIGISPMILALSKVQKYASKAPDITAMGGVLLAVGGVATTLAVILGVLTALPLDPIEMAKYAGALSVAFIGISPMILALSKVQKYASKAPDITAMGGVLLAVGGVATTLAVILSKLIETGLDPFEMAKYAGALSIAFIGISPMILAIAVVQKACSRLSVQSLKPMVGVLISVGGIVLALAAAISLITLTNSDFANSASSFASLSLIFLSMVPLMLTTGVLVALLSKLNIDAASAADAALALSAAVGIVTIIAAGIAGLFGSIDMLTGGGFNEALGEGANVLWSIGEAIGALIGGLLGGIGGATLGSFANTAQPFFDAIAALPDNFGDKMLELAGGFLILAGAGFVSAVTDLFSLFTGESSLTKLGKELSEFGPYMKVFVDNFPDISSDKATSIKYVSESIKSLVDAMPREGGVAQWFTGTSNMDGFTKNIDKLGAGMKKFAEYTVGLDADSVSNAANCGKMMAELANYLPKTGGIVQAWGGEIDMEGFSKNLPVLGKALVDFNNIVTSEGQTVLNETSVATAVNAAKMVAGLWNELPETGGIMQQWFGEKDLEGFARNLPVLGQGITGFNDAVSGENGQSKINQDSVAVAIWVGEEIAGIYKNLPANTWFTTFPDLGDFAKNIELLGVGIRKFSTQSEGVKKNTVDVAIASIEKIAEIQNIITEDKGSWIWEISADKKRLQNFANNIPLFGKGIKGLSDHMAGADLNRINAANDALNAITNIAMLANNLEGFSIETFQKAIENIDTSSFISTAEALASDDRFKTMAQKFKTIGRGYIQNLYVGMEGNDTESKNLLAASAERAINQIKDVMSSLVNQNGLKKSPFYKIGENIVRGLSEGMRDYAATDSVIQAAGDIVAEALWVMASVAKIESPSKRTMQMGKYLMEGYGIGIKDNAKLVTDPANMISEEALSALNEGMINVYRLLSSGEDFKPTISPVVDLTNVRRSAGEIGTLFSTIDDPSYLGTGNNYSLNLTRGVKMEVQSGVKPTDLTTITDGISKVGQKLSDMEKAISDMQIYLDTGALVGSMTVPIMRSMSSQQRKMGRGVIPSRVI